jgi:hypothetical protein
MNTSILRLNRTGVREYNGWRKRSGHTENKVGYTDQGLHRAGGIKSESGSRHLHQAPD